MARKNYVGNFWDERDRSLIQKSGHAHTQPYVVYVRISVMCRYKIELPVDSVVTGVDQHLGEIYLRIQVKPNKKDLLVPRYFYAFANGEYMRFPNLGCIDLIAVGDTVWFVFEDDFYYGETDESPLQHGISGGGPVVYGDREQCSTPGFVYGGTCPTTPNHEG